jgi:uncharacterized protein (DUF58 family)
MNLRRLEWYSRHLSLPLRVPGGGAIEACRAAAHGRGIRFAALREYEYGDDVRTIDWNATARFARPFVKTFEQDRAVDLLILVDCSASLGDATNSASKAAIARELAAVFILVGLRQEQRTSLALFTDRIELSVPLRRGRDHARRLIQRLEGTAVTSRRTDLSVPLRQVRCWLPHPGLVLLISDFAVECHERDLGAVARRHDVFALALVDPSEAELPDVGLVRARDSETGRIRWLDTSGGRARDRFRSAWLTRQREQREVFRRAGAARTEITIGDPYFATLRAACRSFQMRPSR